LKTSRATPSTVVSVNNVVATKKPHLKIFGWKAETQTNPIKIIIAGRKEKVKNKTITSVISMSYISGAWRERIGNVTPITAASSAIFCVATHLEIFRSRTKASR
jgi:hypothetical protein